MILSEDIGLAAYGKGQSIVALDIRLDEDLQNNSEMTCISIKDKPVNELTQFVPIDDYACIFYLLWIGTSGQRRADYEM